MVSLPDPLPPDVVDRLRTDATAALAAIAVIGSSFPGLVAWATKALAGPRGPDWRTLRRQRRNQSDAALLALMRERPDACAAELARLLGRSQTTVGDRLRRLEDQGVVVRERRGWALADPELGAPPAPRIPWIEPLSASHVARHAAGMRVRAEMTQAGND